MTTGSAGPRARPEATAKQDRARSQAKLWAVKSRRRHWRPVTPRWLFGTRAAVARGPAPHRQSEDTRQPRNVFSQSSHQLAQRQNHTGEAALKRSLASARRLHIKAGSRAEPSAALTCRRCRLWPGADACPGKQCGSSEPEPQSRSRPRSGLWRSSEAGTNGEGQGRHLLSRSGKRQGKGTRKALHGLSKLQTHR